MVTHSDMMSDSIAIPFSLSEAYAGFGTAEGILHFENQELSIEFEATLLGLFEGGIKTVSIPLTDLLRIEFKKGWFQSTLHLQAKSMKAFEGIPGTKQGKLYLVIAKSDQSTAEHLATILSTILTTRQIERIKDDLKSI